MKIIENNETSLIIVDNPWKLSLLFSIMGAISLFMFIKYFSSLNQIQIIGTGVNLIFLFFIVHATRKKAYMHFDNKTRTVQWYREEIYKTKQGTFAFDEIETVILKEDVGADARSYTVAIKLKSKEIIPIVIYSSAMEEHKEVRDTIEYWLHSKD